MKNKILIDKKTNSLLVSKLVITWITTLASLGLLFLLMSKELWGLPFYTTLIIPPVLCIAVDLLFVFSYKQIKKNKYFSSEQTKKYRNIQISFLSIVTAFVLVIFIEWLIKDGDLDVAWWIARVCSGLIFVFLFATAIYDSIIMSKVKRQK